VVGVVVHVVAVGVHDAAMAVRVAIGAVVVPVGAVVVPVAAVVVPVTAAAVVPVAVVVDVAVAVGLVVTLGVCEEPEDSANDFGRMSKGICEGSGGVRGAQEHIGSSSRGFTGMPGNFDLPAAAAARASA